MLNNGGKHAAGGNGVLLSTGESLADIVRAEDGLISRRIFADPEVYKMELEQIFARNWFFLGHESEIPNPGDLMTRPCGMDPAIVLRDDDGEIRVFLNSCRHRGMRVCRTDKDNQRFLRCPYHGWAYRNDGTLVSVAAESHYGEGELDKDELGLIPVAKMGMYHGLIFATWDKDAPSLDAWLGDAKWYLDIIFNRCGGIEVIGTPQVWDVDCSWKFATDNFTDNFHVFSAHHSLVELGLLPNDPDFASHGNMVTLNDGHILHFVPGPPKDEAFMGLGLPKEMWPLFDKHLNPAQAKLARANGYSAGTIWPNFHWLNLVSAGDMNNVPYGFLNLRMETPISPTRTRMYSWFVVDKAAPAEFRKNSYETYVRTFGPAGIFDQDDMENWEDCTVANLGPAAKRHALHHKMGINRTPDPNWPGPGIGYPDSYGEMTQRNWYKQWRKMMTTPLVTTP